MAKPTRAPFRTIVSDPPWQFSDRLPGPKRGAAKHYSTLSLDDLKAFPLPPIADDALLFLWRVSAMQEEALAVMRAWGFTPKAEIVWVKTRGIEPAGSPRLHFGMGRTVRASHETCLIGKRGRPSIRSHSIRSVFFAPVGRHSEKPAEFFGLVEQLAEPPFVELFARERRVGWISYGDELPRKGAA